MRKLVWLVVFLFAVNSFSQNKQILYNFTAVPQSLMTNPGSDFKYDWYIGVPLLSGISANVGSSGFSAYDLFANNSVDFNDKLRNVVFSTSRKDKLAINEQVEILNGGFKISGEENDTYVSFGMYQEFDAISYVPKDLAILALDGNKNYLGKVFDLGDLSAKAEMLNTCNKIAFAASTKSPLCADKRVTQAKLKVRISVRIKISLLSENSLSILSLVKCLASVLNSAVQDSFKCRRLSHKAKTTPDQKAIVVPNATPAIPICIL